MNFIRNGFFHERCTAAVGDILFRDTHVSKKNADGLAVSVFFSADGLTRGSPVCRNANATTTDDDSGLRRARRVYARRETTTASVGRRTSSGMQMPRAFGHGRLSSFGGYTLRSYTRAHTRPHARKRDEHRLDQ